MEEPLNLTIRKKPVAIVAPSAVLDTNENIKPTNNNNSINNNNNTNNNNKTNSDKQCEDGPEDLSVKKPQEEEEKKQPPPYNKQTNKDSNLNNNEFNFLQYNNEELRNYLFKSVGETRNIYNKNTFEETIKEHDLKSNIFKDVYKITDFYETLTNKNLAAPKNIYSVINHLAEHKFLTAWYMNSVLSMPYLNLNPKSFAQNTNSPAKNSILNNLLDKKTSADYKTTLNFDTLIKNEMHAENYTKNGNKATR